jgi:hypothetical protein
LLPSRVLWQPDYKPVQRFSPWDCTFLDPDSCPALGSPSAPQCCSKVERFWWIPCSLCRCLVLDCRCRVSYRRGLEWSKLGRGRCDADCKCLDLADPLSCWISILRRLSR